MKSVKAGLAALLIVAHSVFADNPSKNTPQNSFDDRYDLQEYNTVYNHDGSIAKEQIIYLQGCMCTKSFHYKHGDKREVHSPFYVPLKDSASGTYVAHFFDTRDNVHRTVSSNLYRRTHTRYDPASEPPCSAYKFLSQPPCNEECNMDCNFGFFIRGFRMNLPCRIPQLQ